MNNVRRLSNLLVISVFLTTLLGGCVQTAECDRVTGCAGSRKSICHNYECVKTCKGHKDCGEDELCLPCEESDDCLESGALASSKVCVEE